MEEPENSKPWFITHDGERTGPYSMDELKAKAELHELHPRFDMLWKEGIDDWIVAGEVDGLFTKNTDAEAIEKKQSSSDFNEFENDADSQNKSEDDEWDGVSRGAFFFFCCIFPVIWIVALFFGTKMLKDIVEADLLPFIVGCLALLPIFTGIFAILKRFQNLAMSRFWIFGLLVPGLNFWLGHRLFVCPPGYTAHKKFGVFGWFLAIIYWPLILAATGLGVITAIKGPEIFNQLTEKYPVPEKYRAKYEEYFLEAKQLFESAEETKSREAEEKRSYHHSDPVIQTSKQTDELLQAARRAAKASDETPIPVECWCLHGAVGAASDWRSLTGNLAKTGISTRAVDLWRFLQCESVTMSEFGQRLNAEAEGEVSRSQKRILVGYSMGGRLALHALLEGGPWDAAIIISANPGIQDPDEASRRRNSDTQWATRALTESWSDFLLAWNEQPILRGAIRDEREDKKLIQRRREIARSFVDWSVGNQQNLWSRLTEIQIPVLWVAGEHDEKFSAMAAQAANLSDRFQLAIAPKCGHRVPWENEAWILDRIHQQISAL